MKRCQRCGQEYDDRIETCTDCGREGRLIHVSAQERAAELEAEAARSEGMSWARLVVGTVMAGVLILCAWGLGKEAPARGAIEWLPVLALATRVLSVVLAAAGALYLITAPGNLFGRPGAGRFVPGAVFLLGAATLSGEGTWAAPLALALLLVVPRVCDSFGRIDPRA